MIIWCLEYFEDASLNAYMSETYFSAEKRDAAIARYLRLGGDDVLKITSEQALDHVRFWLRKICF
jgi:hypothetical protein